MADNYDLQNQNVSLHPLNNTSTFLYPRGVKNLSFAYNLVVNTNGQQFEGYQWTSIESPVGGDYTVKQFRYANSSDPVYNVETIREYMLYMTGTDYVPIYSGTEPNDMFIYLSSSEEVWKYQYDSSYGLVVFKVNNFPFALKSQIKEFPKTIEVQGTPDAEYNRIYFDINESNLSAVKAISIRITIEENDKDHYGSYYAESVPRTVVFDNGTGILQDANWKWDSYEGSFARFQLMFDALNPPVNYSDINFVTAEITLY